MLSRYEVKPATQEQVDIAKLIPGNTYGKLNLAKLWGLDRRTVYRWHQVALDFAPGYYTGFQGSRIIAQCVECNHSQVIDDLWRMRIRRPSYKYVCPGCFEDELKPEIKVQQYTRNRVHLTATQATVLRLVGGLIQNHGTAETKRILTSSNESKHKKLRNFLRNINWEKHTK
jgi:hypothetical protein